MGAGFMQPDRDGKGLGGGVSGNFGGHERNSPAVVSVYAVGTHHGRYW